MAGPVRDAVCLQKEALRKNSHQPTESTSAPPTNNPDNKESTDDDDDEDRGGQGNGETMVGGKKRASNEANEAVASTKRKTPVKGNSESDSSETPAWYVTCDSPHHLHSVWT